MEVHHPIAVSDGSHGRPMAESRSKIRREIVMAREGELLDFGQQSQQQQPTVVGKCIRPHLSRMITQPRGLYEAVVHTYGPTTATDISGVVEAAQVQGEDVYQSPQAGDISDGGTCSSHEDGTDGHSDDRRDGGLVLQDGHWQERHRDHTGQAVSKGRGKVRTPRLSDEEWAKSILARSTGYGCTQRNQVVKYITQLEQNVEEWKTKVSALSPQVEVLDQHRWMLQGENDALKQRISDLKRYEIVQKDEISALQKEMQVLRMRKLQQQWQQDMGQSIAVGDRLGGVRGGDSSLAVTTRFSAMSMRDRCHLSIDDFAHSSIQLDDYSGNSKKLSCLGHGREAHERGHPTETSRELPLSCSSSANAAADISPGYSRRAEDRGVTNPSLVKWPSTLYRSVSAIRQDLLEVATQDRA